MAGSKTGAVTTRLQKELWALYNHCYGHDLNLAVQESEAKNILQNMLDAVEEMIRL